MATCESCRFFYVPEEGDVSFCRRMPPVVLPAVGKGGMAGVKMALPIVQGGDWCGEYQERVRWPAAAPTKPAEEPAHVD